jgi:hypothetical protein
MWTHIMPIRFVCPLCWAVRSGLDDSLLGKLIKCQECHAMSVATHTPEPKLSRGEGRASFPAAGPLSGPSAPLSPYPLSGEGGEAAPLPLAGPAPTVPPRAEAPARVLLSTGDIPQRYEIVDLVFAHGNSTEGFLKDVAPLQAFQIVSNLLGQTALQIGANAVVHIRLEFRLAGQGFLGARQAFEVYGYGTAVRLLG